MRCILFTLETKRLILRPLTEKDEINLKRTLQDEKAMYAYEGAFTDEEVTAWLTRQLARYEKWGFGLYAVILKETGAFIGQCGLTYQPWRGGRSLKWATSLSGSIGIMGMPRKQLGPLWIMPLIILERTKCRPSSAIPTKPPRTLPAATACIPWMKM